ncbi:MAG TPA: hypothetical protein VMU95_05060 [Trebonia sp.]|nr:hypothetical protein [Trebonia sp.]
MMIVAVGLLLINGTQLWASTWYGYTGPSVYARLLVSRHLPLLVEKLTEENWLTCSLGLDPADIYRLRQAAHAEVEAVAEFFRASGWPRRHEPAQLTAFLVSLATFIAGLFLGAYLPQYDQNAFQKLCGVPVSRALTPPPILILLALVVFALFISAKIINRRLIARVSASFNDDPVKELSGLLDPQFAQRVGALQVDLKRAALLVELSEEQAEALQSLGSTKLASRDSFYTRIRWSAETDLIIAQVEFVLGLYLGLAMPPLLGIGC